MATTYGVTLPKLTSIQSLSVPLPRHRRHQTGHSYWMTASSHLLGQQGSGLYLGNSRVAEDVDSLDAPANFTNPVPRDSLTSNHNHGAWPVICESSPCPWFEPWLSSTSPHRPLSVT